MSGLPRNPWTDAEDTIVRQMTADKRPASAIAQALGTRSATGVRMRRRILGISPGSHNNGKRPKDRGTRVQCLIGTIQHEVAHHGCPAHVRELRTGLIVLLARERGV